MTDMTAFMVSKEIQKVLQEITAELRRIAEALESLEAKR